MSCNNAHRMLTIFTILAFLLPHKTLRARIVLKGNESASKDTSFSFPINKHVTNRLRNKVFVAADASVNKAGLAKEFALSFVDNTMMQFRPIAPEIINLNGQSRIRNPLFDAGIMLLDITATEGNTNDLRDKLVIVKSDELSTLYLLSNFNVMNTENMTLHAIRNINDADGKKTSGIIALASTLGQDSVTSPLGFFSAVGPNGGTFGQNGSGIAVVGIDGTSAKTNDANNMKFQQLKANPAKPEEVAATPVNVETNALKITNNLAAIGPNVDLFFDNKLKRLYGGLSVTAGAGANDGARAILLGHTTIRKQPMKKKKKEKYLKDLRKQEALENKKAAIEEAKRRAEHWKIWKRIGKKYKKEQAERKKAYEQRMKERAQKRSPSALIEKVFDQIKFVPIAPDSAFAGANQIVGAVGSSETVTICQVKTMQTSMGLSYLVVLGGNNDTDAQKNTVYALPLVDTTRLTQIKDKEGNVCELLIPSDSELHGTLANKNSKPKLIFQNCTLVARVINEPATEPSHLFTTDTDSEGKPTPENRPAHVGCGPLTVGDIDELFIAGDAIYAVVSEAVGGEKPGIFHSQALFDKCGGIKAWTMWQRVAGTTDPVFGAEYDAGCGNFTLLCTDSTTTPAVVKRTQWGTGNPDGLQPLVTTIGQLLPPEQCGIHGLSEFHAGVTPCVQDMAMLIATGSNTVVLVETAETDTDATPCPNSGNAFNNVQQFTDGRLTANGNANVISISGGVLNTIGSIVTSDIGCVNDTTGYLFVGGIGGLAVLSTTSNQGFTAPLQPNFNQLTNGMSFKTVGNYQFVRKVVADNNFLYVLTDMQLDRLDLSQPGFPATTIALAVAPQTFNDLLTSDALALLATTTGLFRTGNGRDVRTATNATEVAWTEVPLAENCNPVKKLQPISATGRAQDIARDKGGNVYVLSSYRGLERAQLNRLCVNAPQNGITDETVQSIKDQIKQNYLAPRTNFGGYRDLFFTDGAVNLSAKNFDQPNQCALHNGLGAFPVTICLDGLPCNFTALERNSASGAWLVAGGFGLRVNE